MLRRLRLNGQEGLDLFVLRRDDARRLRTRSFYVSQLPAQLDEIVRHRVERLSKPARRRAELVEGVCKRRDGGSRSNVREGIDVERVRLRGTLSTQEDWIGKPLNLGTTSSRDVR